MIEVFERLEADQDVIKTAIAEAGDDIQKKMMTVIPLLQKTLAGPLQAYGFPAGGPGAPQCASLLSYLTRRAALLVTPPIPLLSLVILRHHARRCSIPASDKL